MAFNKQMTNLSQARIFNEGYPDDFRALCLFKWCRAPTMWLLFQLPKACNVKLESSVFSVMCLFIFGSCQVRTKECTSSSSSFNTELLQMYSVQVLRGAACCCTIHQRLLPLLYVMQFCFEKVLGKSNFDMIPCAVSLQTESCRSLGRKHNFETQTPEYLQGLPAVPLLSLSVQNLTYEIILTLGQAFEVAYQLALQAQRTKQHQNLPVGPGSEVIETKSSRPVPKPRGSVRKSAVSWTNT